MFVPGALTATAMTIRNVVFTKATLDKAIDFMDDEEKARYTVVSSNIERARVLLDSVFLELMSMGEDPAEVNRDAR